MCKVWVKKLYVWWKRLLKNCRKFLYKLWTGFKYSIFLVGVRSFSEVIPGVFPHTYWDKNRVSRPNYSTISTVLTITTKYIMGGK